MKRSRGIFPASRTPNRRDRAKGGGSAGNSSGGDGNRQGGNGYETGMVGWKGSRQSGGENMDQKLVDKPMYVDDMRSSPGEGGCAWDKSMAPYMDDKGKPKGIR
jgi:hypothetical protein